MTVAGVPRLAPLLEGHVIFDQHWCDLAFLHWPVEVEAVRRYLPPGVEPDVFEGRTYVGLVPFRMRRAGPGRRLPVPYFGDFVEWNVRLYSVDAQGRHGVVFRSLDATRFAVVAAARWGMRVPYVYSRIQAMPYPATRADPLPELAIGTRRSWQLRRRFPGPAATSSLSLRIGAAVEPTPLEVFLTSRWGMHSRLGRGSWWVPNEHGPWPLREATVELLDDTLVAAAGLIPAGPMLRPLWTPGVHARFGVPQRV